VVGFTGCKITGTAAAGSYTLTATRGGLTAATSGSFSIIAGIATQFGFTSQPVGNVIEGTNFSTQPTVASQDVNGNTVTSDNGTVTIAVNTYTSGNGGTTQGTLACTTTGFPTITLTSGSATLAGCKITGTAGAGTYTLKATRAALTGTSTNVVINAGVVSTVSITTPSNSTGGVAFTAQPIVTVKDASGNGVSGDTVTLAIGTNAGPGGTLTCASTSLTTGAPGTAAGSNCSIDKKGNGYTLTATDGAVSGTSTTFNITVGPATQLAFTTQPAGAVPATAFTTQPVVSVEDAGGNVVTGATNSITLAIKSGTGTAGAALTCTANPKAAVAGVDTFAGCKIDQAGTAYELTAAASGLTTASSASFDVTVPTVTPSSLALTNTSGGTAGKPEAADTIVITFGAAIDPTGICGKWNNDGTDQSASGTAIFTKGTAGGNDVITFTTGNNVCGNGSNNKITLGSIDLGATGYVNTTVNFTGSTISYSASTHAVTVTLGSPSPTSYGAGTTASHTAVYTPPAGLQNQGDTITVTGTASVTGSEF
jgi:hypothetical protein